MQKNESKTTKTSEEHISSMIEIHNRKIDFLNLQMEETLFAMKEIIKDNDCCLIELKTKVIAGLGNLIDSYKEHIITLIILNDITEMYKEEILYVEKIKNEIKNIAKEKG